MGPFDYESDLRNESCHPYAVISQSSSVSLNSERIWEWIEQKMRWEIIEEILLNYPESLHFLRTKSTNEAYYLILNFVAYSICYR